jgi:hypothetical protein
MKATGILLAVVIASRLFAQSPCDISAPIPFNEHGKWGYVSEKGILIPPRFDVAGPFSDDTALVCVADTCSFINKTGSSTSVPWNRHSRPFPERFTEGLAPANDGDAWGYVDRNRKLVIPLQFLYAGHFDHGMARVRVGDKFFFIDNNGNRITAEFDAAFDFQDDLASVRVGNKAGFIRRDGSFALIPQYESAGSFSEGLASFSVDGKKVGFIDKAGNVVVEPTYTYADSFSDGLASVRLGNLWGYADKSGKVVIPIKYAIAHKFSEGLASVMLGDKWGYINRAGEYVIPPIFDAAMPFCGGVAAVETYQTIGKVSHGCRAALMKGKHGFIDHAGNYVWRDNEDQTWQSPFCL